MSQLACITVHRCDACGRIVTLQNDEDYREFEHSWYAGFGKDFCDRCSARHENRPAILADKAFREQVVARVERINRIAGIHAASAAETEACQ
jgi:hypothetical protein